MTPQRRQAIDPAVADLLAGAEQRQADQRRPLKEKKLAAKARAKAASRPRITLDIPEPLQARLADLAESYSCPISQVAARLIQSGLADLDAGHVRLDDNRKPSRSPRYLWTLEL